MDFMGKKKDVFVVLAVKNLQTVYNPRPNIPHSVGIGACLYRLELYHLRYGTATQHQEITSR